MLRRLLLAASLVCAAAVLTPVSPASAAACAGGDGVTVVVQFPNGSTSIGCAPGDPTSGLAALKGAGFGYTFAPNEPGFVCQIDGAPGDQNCMKPNYWAYYHASAGGSWRYSTVGAGSFDPAPGSVEGWRFGSGSAPSTAPPGTGSPKPSPKPTPKPTPKPKPTPTPTATPTATASATPTASPTPKATKKPTPQATPSATPSPVIAAAEPPTPAVPAPADSTTWWIGGGLVLVLAVATALIGVRRRRQRS